MDLKPLPANVAFERAFLETRSKLLDIAANLDRVERGSGTVAGDPRRAQIDAALEILRTPGADRAERLQMLFSRPYDAEWLHDALHGELPRTPRS